MTPYCFPHNAGRWRELEVGAGGLPHKRKSNHSRFICSWLLRLDDDVRRGPRKRKEKDAKEKRREEGKDGGGGGVGGVWWSRRV